MSDDNTPSEWMNEKDLATILGKSPFTLATERSRGRFHPPFYKFGQKVRYKRVEVDEWIATCRRVTAATQLAAEAT